MFRGRASPSFPSRTALNCCWNSCIRPQDLQVEGRFLGHLMAVMLRLGGRRAVGADGLEPGAAPLMGFMRSHGRSRATE